MMATGWWWPSSSLPAWLGSEAVWFVALNAAVAAVAILSARARPSWSSSSPRHGGAGVTRRASSAVLQSLRSFSIFSFPSACLSFLQPDAVAFAYQETEKLVRSPTTKPSPRALTPTPPPPAPAADEDGDEEEEDPSAMSMDEAYALVLASRQQRPEREQEEEARRSEVDTKAEEFIREFREDLRQQRLKSIFNYTQMLKQRGLAAGRRQPDQL